MDNESTLGKLLSKRVSRRTLLKTTAITTVAAGLAACGPASSPSPETKIKLPPIAKTETPPPDPLFSLSVDGQEVIIYPLSDAGNIPSTPGRAYSWNQVHDKSQNLFWILAHNTVDSGNLINDSSDPKTQVLINGQAAEFTQSFSVQVGPPKPDKSEPDYINLKQNTEYSPGQILTPEELQKFILKQETDGYTTFVLQTCIKQGDNNEWGRVFSVWRTPLK